MDRGPEHVVVVGAGAAGWTVAAELRRLGFDRRLTLVGGERHLPYDRPPLSKQILAGTWPVERVGLATSDELAGLDAEVRLGVPVRSLTLTEGAHSLLLADGSVIEADEVVAATGCTPRRLPGTAGLSNVVTLRTLDDAHTLRAALKQARRLVVVGAGFLGLEVAAAARAMGVEVDVVSDLAPMVRPLGSAFSERLTRLHQAHGVRLHIGLGVTGWATEGRKVVGVQSGAETIPADLVLVAVGAVPDAGWLQHTGLDLSAGVPCDAYGRAAPGLHAVGDVACWWHPRYERRVRTEHRTNAAEQAMVVARDLVGQEQDPYDGVPFWWTDQYDAKIQAYGLPGSDADEQILDEGDEGPTLVGYGRAGRLDGVVGWGNIRGTRQARQLVIEKTLFPVDATDLDLTPRRPTPPGT